MVRIWIGIYCESIAEKERVKTAIVVASPENIRVRGKRSIVYRGPVKNDSLRIDAQRLKIALDEQRPGLSGLIRLGTIKVILNIPEGAVSAWTHTGLVEVRASPRNKNARQLFRAPARLVIARTLGRAGDRV